MAALFVGLHILSRFTSTNSWLFELQMDGAHDCRLIPFFLCQLILLEFIVLTDKIFDCFAEIQCSGQHFISRVPTSDDIIDELQCDKFHKLATLLKSFCTDVT